MKTLSMLKIKRVLRSFWEKPKSSWMMQCMGTMKPKNKFSAM